MSGAAEQEPGAPAATGRRVRTAADWRLSLSTLAVGAAVIAFLTWYNLTGFQLGRASSFPQGRSWEEYLLVNVTGLVFPPFLLVFTVLRMPASAFGFRPSVRGIWRLALLFFVVMLPVLWVVSLRPEFRSFYPMQPQAAYDWRFFFYFETTYGFYLFCWEWFYRGFLTFGLERALGAGAAIAIQAAAFGIMHWGKPPAEFASSFVGGAILGWLALRARSFLPGFWIHWGIAVVLDCLAIHARAHGLF